MSSAPPWIWNVSGGSPPVIRVARTALAFEPAPPAMTALTISMPGCCCANTSSIGGQAVRLATGRPVREDLHLAAARATAPTRAAPAERARPRWRRQPRRRRAPRQCPPVRRPFSVDHVACSLLWSYRSDRQYQYPSARVKRHRTHAAAWAHRAADSVVRLIVDEIVSGTLAAGERAALRARARRSASGWAGRSSGRRSARSTSSGSSRRCRRAARSCVPVRTSAPTGRRARDPPAGRDRARALGGAPDARDRDGARRRRVRATAGRHRRGSR